MRIPWLFPQWLRCPHPCSSCFVNNLLLWLAIIFGLIVAAAWLATLVAT